MSTCYAELNPTFQPAMRLVTAITNSFPAEVTTSFRHQYKSGIIVRFVIPPADGMQQINNATATIVVTGDTTFTVAIDTTHYTPFEIPVTPTPAYANTCAMVIPIGEVNELLTNAVRNVLPYSAS